MDEWEKEGKTNAEKCGIVVSVKLALADAGAFLLAETGHCGRVCLNCGRGGILRHNPSINYGQKISPHNGGYLNA